MNKYRSKSNGTRGKETHAAHIPSSDAWMAADMLGSKYQSSSFYKVDVRQV